MVTRDWLEYSVRGTLSQDVTDWAPFVLENVTITGGGSRLPVRVGAYGGRNVQFTNVSFSSNAQVLLSNCTDVRIVDSIFDGNGIKFSQDSTRVLLRNVRISNLGPYNFQGEERPVSLTWNPRGVGNVVNVSIINCKFSNYSGTSNRTNSYSAIHLGRAIEAPYSIVNFVRTYSNRHCDGTFLTCSLLFLRMFKTPILDLWEKSSGRSRLIIAFTR